MSVSIEPFGLYICLLIYLIADLLQLRGIPLVPAEHIDSDGDGTLLPPETSDMAVSKELRSIVLRDRDLHDKVLVILPLAIPLTLGRLSELLSHSFAHTASMKLRTSFALGSLI